MSTESISYEAVLADLEARRAQLEAAIQAIRAIAGMPSMPPTPSMAPASSGGQSIPSDAFLGMSIPEATKKLLATVRRRLSTPDIMKMLVQGGAPEPAYNTAYAVLRRRQLQVGDIVNINGEWGLKEWTPNYKAPTKSTLFKRKNDQEDDGAPVESEEAELDQK